MLEKQNESEDDNPVDKANLNSFNPDIVFDVHDFLQLFVAFLDLPPCVHYMKVDTIEYRPLLYNQIRDVAEQVRQTIHLCHYILNLLLLYTSDCRVRRLYLFDQLLFLFFFHPAIACIPISFIKFAQIGQTNFSLNAIQFGRLVDILAFHLSQSLCSIL